MRFSSKSCFHVRGKRLVRGEALRNLAIEFAEIAALGPEHVLHIETAIAGQLGARNERVRRQARVLGADALGQAGAHHLQMHKFAAWAFAARNGAGEALFPGRRNLGHGDTSVQSNIKDGE